MSSWVLTGSFNGVISVAYLTIATIITSGLVRTKQLGSNRLAVATAAIFLTCGVAHGHHALTMLGAGTPMEMSGMQMMFGDWYGAVFDGATAMVAVIYLAMRRSYGVLLRSPAMFDQSSDAHYRQLVANLPQTRVLLIDRDARVMLGAGGEEGGQDGQTAALEGRVLWDAIPAASAEILRSPVADALAGRSSDFEFVSPVNGDHLHARSRPIHGSDDAVTGALLVFEDVSAQRALQAELAEAMAFNQAVRDASPDITTITDLHTGAITWSSRSMWEAFGWDPPDDVAVLDGAVFDPSVAPDEVARVQEANQAVAELAAGSTQTLRYRARGGDGQRWVSRRTTPFDPAAHGSTSRGLSVIRDVTEAVAAERATAQLNEELARSNTELEQFAYIASHDLQEPLRHISAFAQKFADRYRGVIDERGDRYIGYIVDGSERLQALIAGLLEFSRVGRATLHPEPVQLDDVVAAAIRGVSITAAKADAMIDAGRLPVVLGDRDMLYRLFLNLLSNAIKFARPDQPARVHITATTDADGRDQVLVADNGIGVDPQYRDRVFDIFERLNGHDYPGTGIGLSVARRIVDAHGASITLTESPAGGALVTITFPASDTVRAGTAA